MAYNSQMLWFELGTFNSLACVILQNMEPVATSIISFNRQGSLLCCAFESNWRLKSTTFCFWTNWVTSHVFFFTWLAEINLSTRSWFCSRPAKQVRDVVYWSADKMKPLLFHFAGVRQSRSISHMHPHNEGLKRKVRFSMNCRRKHWVETCMQQMQPLELVLDLRIICETKIPLFGKSWKERRYFVLFR